MSKLQPKSVLLLFAISVCCLLLLPRVLSYGIFFDGVTYSSIARNLADGYGSFWKPYYTDTAYPVFYEHPAFAFLIQSYFFKVFGEAYFLDALYGTLLCFVLLLLMGALWKKISSGTEVLSGAWVVLLFFASLPIVSWAFSNNMLENTFSIVIFISVYFVYKSFDVKSTMYELLFAFFSGVFIFIAFLTKGPGGLFPVVIPFLAFAILRNISLKKMALLSGMQITGILVCIVFIILPSQEAINFFSHYFNNQLKRSMMGQREVAGSHFALLNKLFYESLVPIALGAIVWLWQRGKLSFPGRLALFFFAIAASGSIPFLLSPKQMGWYIIPALPFYMFALAIVFTNQTRRLEEKLHVSKLTRDTIYWIAAFGFLLSILIMASEYKVVRKEKTFFTEIYSRNIDFHRRELVSVYPKELTTAWGLVANMERHYKSSLSDSLIYPYCIVQRGSENDPILKRNNYSSVVSSGSTYVILQKSKQ